MPRGRLDPNRQGLNKWEMHKALLHGLDKRTADSSFHIPETRYGRPQEVAYMLRHYPTVFIKPVAAWGGSGITRIDTAAKSGEANRVSGSKAETDSGTDSAGSNTYIWHKQGEQQLRLQSVHHAVQQFLQSYMGQPVIVQAGAPLRNLAGRPFDIRVLMQRNNKEEWVYSGAVGRVGGSGSVVSNIALSHGQVMDVKEICRQLQCNQKTTQSVLTQLQRTGYAIAKVVGEYRDFFDIGIDLGLSRNNSLWLIEVNTDDALGGPSHQLFAKLPDTKLYEEIQNRHRATRDRRGEALMRELQELF